MHDRVINAFLGVEWRHERTELVDTDLRDEHKNLQRVNSSVLRFRLTRQTAIRLLIHAIDLAPQLHEFTQFLRCRYLSRSSGRTVGATGTRRNSGLLKHDIETGIGWNGDADVLRIRRVRQLLFACKRDIARQTISQ